MLEVMSIRDQLQRRRSKILSHLDELRRRYRLEDRTEVERLLLARISDINRQLKTLIDAERGLFG